MNKKSFSIEAGAPGIKQLQDYLNNLNNNLDKLLNGVVGELAEVSSNKMQEVYNNSGVEDSTPMDFSVVGTNADKTVSMSGEQALYDEFGTGTIGSENPHPMKNNFNLNPYNSGSTIRKNESADSIASLNGIPVGALYWTYIDNNGNKIYTQGIAAQKEGYEAFHEALNQAPKIIGKKMGELQ